MKEYILPFNKQYNYILFFSLLSGKQDVLISSGQSLSHVQLFATPRTASRQASLSITNSQSLLKLMSVESVMPSNHLILCRTLLLSPSIFPSIRGGAWWATVYGVAQSWTRLKRLSSSSSKSLGLPYTVLVFAFEFLKKADGIVTAVALIYKSV